MLRFASSRRRSKRPPPRGRSAPTAVSEPGRASASLMVSAADLRRDCQAGGDYRKPEVGRTLLWSGGAMLPRLGWSWPFDGLMAHRPPRPTEAAWPLVARAGRNLAPQERAHGAAYAHRRESSRRDAGGRCRWNKTGRVRFRDGDPQA